MPTIKLSHNDVQQLLGKKISLNELENVLAYAKAELEHHDGDLLEVAFQDTNQPYLWSAEGLVRLLKGVLGFETGVPELSVKKGAKKILVDKSLERIRPFIAGFVASKGIVTENLLKQLIQLQERVSEGYGRKRKKVAMGIYPATTIQFPLHYTVADPEKTTFVPLEFTTSLSLSAILRQHPTGQKYAHLLQGLKKYPVLRDAEGTLLSFIPIINSETTGRVRPVAGESTLFFEATGDDAPAVRLASTIFAYALRDRGFTIETVTSEYDTQKETHPHTKSATITLKWSEVSRIIGLDMRPQEIKHLLEKARYSVNGTTVQIPPYRHDIMHPVDIIEDIAIQYGFNKITPEPLRTQTIGGTTPLQEKIDTVRELLIGLGYQEVMSAILSNKEALYTEMNIRDSGTVEIQDPISETYGLVRSWLTPILVDVLSKNKHVDYPQKLFEQGLVSVREGTRVWDEQRVALVSTHTQVTFTEIKQALEFLCNNLPVSYTLRDLPESHPCAGSFIPGRAGIILTKEGSEVGFLGELHPQVLSNHGLELPVVALEVNLTTLFH